MNKFSMLNETISDDEEVGLSKNQLKKLKKNNNKPNKANKPINIVKQPNKTTIISSDSDTDEEVELIKNNIQPNKTTIISSDMDIIKPILSDSKSDDELTSRELFSKAYEYDSMDDNIMALKYYKLSIKKVVELHPILTKQSLKLMYRACSNIALLDDINIGKDIIEIMYKVSICAGNYKILYDYADYSRNRKYLLEYASLEKYDDNSDIIKLWKELIFEELFEELKLINFINLF